MAEQEERLAGALSTPGPLYLGLKQEIRRRIENREWPPDHRIPSEHALVKSFGVSRMTANRALRELAHEGLIRRVQGVGSFVSQPKGVSALVEVRNIAEEVRERGHLHRSSVARLSAETGKPAACEALGLPPGSEVFHSVIVHYENDVPVQIEDRLVNPFAAPDYLAQDFVAATPNAYLTGVAPISRAEQSVEAVLPQDWECDLLDIARGEPCLSVRRRTWSAGRTVTTARLVYPGSRYRLEGAFGG